MIQRATHIPQNRTIAKMQCGIGLVTVVAIIALISLSVSMFSKAAILLNKETALYQSQFLNDEASFMLLSSLIYNEQVAERFNDAMQQSFTHQADNTKDDTGINISDIAKQTSSTLFRDIRATLRYQKPIALPIHKALFADNTHTIESVQTQPPNIRAHLFEIEISAETPLSLIQQTIGFSVYLQDSNLLPKNTQCQLIIEPELIPFNCPRQAIRLYVHSRRPTA